MNPGTILFIVLGLIGLLIYISKAIQPILKENFAVIDESQISNKGKDGLQSLKDGALNFESLLGAFSTPDVNLDRNLNHSPSVSEFAKFNKPTESPFPLTQDKDTYVPEPVPIPSFAPLPQPVHRPLPSIETPALPVLTPSSIINMPSTPQKPIEPPLAPSITMSDIQGSILPKSTESFKQRETSYKKRRKRKVVYIPTKCPPMPDMSQYIRKDSIPCWGCNLK